MRNPTSLRENSATAILWIARCSTLPILCFWGYFLIAHLVGNANADAPSRELTFRDSATVAMVVASLVGLVLAMKWHRLGAVTTIVAVAIGAGINWQLVMFPYSLIPFAAVLFLVSSYLRSAEPDHCVETIQ
jgi:hypothetical protein